MAAYIHPRRRLFLFSGMYTAHICTVVGLCLQSRDLQLILTRSRPILKHTARSGVLLAWGGPDEAAARLQAAQERAERERQQLQGLTFTPRISRLAQNLKRNDSEQSFDRLAKRGTLTLQVCCSKKIHEV